MLDREVLNSFLKENFDKEITVCLNERTNFTGTLKKVELNHFVLSNYATNKFLVSSNDVIACYSVTDRPEDKYLPTMSDKVRG